MNNATRTLQALHSIRATELALSIRLHDGGRSIPGNGYLPTEVAEESGLTVQQTRNALAQLARRDLVYRWVFRVEVRGRKNSRAKIPTAFYAAKPQPQE